MINLLKSKIHRATVTQAALDYVGSITIDEKLMQAANISEYEKVQIADVNNGNRFETYVIAGTAGSGTICLNGAAAREVQLNDKVIIMTYSWLNLIPDKPYKPRVVLVDQNNQMTQITNYEHQGQLISQPSTRF